MKIFDQKRKVPGAISKRAKRLLWGPQIEDHFLCLNMIKAVQIRNDCLTDWLKQMVGNSGHSDSQFKIQTWWSLSLESKLMKINRSFSQTMNSKKSQTESLVFDNLRSDLRSYLRRSRFFAINWRKVPIRGSRLLNSIWLKQNSVTEFNKNDHCDD